MSILTGEELIPLLGEGVPATAKVSSFLDSDWRTANALTRIPLTIAGVSATVMDVYSGDIPINARVPIVGGGGVSFDQTDLNDFALGAHIGVTIGVTIRANGSGYAVDDQLFPADYETDLGSVVAIDAVDDDGGILSAHIFVPGLYKGQATPHETETSGAGNGADVVLHTDSTLGGVIRQCDISNGGERFMEGDQVLLDAGDGDAQLLVTATEPPTQEFPISSVTAGFVAPITGKVTATNTLTVGGDRHTVPVGAPVYTYGATADTGVHYVVSATFDTDHTDFVVSPALTEDPETVDGSLCYTGAVLVSGDHESTLNDTLDGRLNSPSPPDNAGGFLVLGATYSGGTGKTSVFGVRFPDPVAPFLAGTTQGNIMTGGEVIATRMLNFGQGYVVASDVDATPIGECIGTNLQINILEIISGEDA